MALKIVFNALTGNFDYINDSISGSQTPNFVSTFNNTTDWGSPSGGLYTYTLLASTHNKGLNPVVQILQQSGAEYEIIGIDYTVNASGNITLKVLEVPDNRFNGKFIISENN